MTREEFLHTKLDRIYKQSEELKDLYNIRVLLFSMAGADGLSAADYKKFLELLACRIGQLGTVATDIWFEAKDQEPEAEVGSDADL